MRPKTEGIVAINSPSTSISLVSAGLTSTLAMSVMVLNMAANAPSIARSMLSPPARARPK